MQRSRQANPGGRKRREAGNNTGKAKAIINGLPRKTFLERHPLISWKNLGEETKELFHSIVQQPVPDFHGAIRAIPGVVLCEPKGDDPANGFFVYMKKDLDNPRGFGVFITEERLRAASVRGVIAAPQTMVVAATA